MDERVHCEHARTCAGCPQIDRAYDEQLAFKTSRVRRAFARYPVLQHVNVLATRGAERRTEYRTRSKLIAGPKNALGIFSKEGDHSVVDVPRCRVMSPLIAKGVDAVRAWLASEASPSLKTAADGGRLTAIDVREVRLRDRVQLLLTLILTRPAGLDALERAALAKLERVVPSLGSLAVSYVDKKAVQVLGRDAEILLGAAVVEDAIGRSRVFQLATHGSFVQAHRDTTAGILDQVLHDANVLLGDLAGKRIVDFFAGSGAFGLTFAHAGAEVLLVESYEPAVAHAKEAAARQALRGVNAFAGDTESVAQQLSDADVKVDGVIVNPPRRGVERSARASIASLRPEFIAYVSCHPETLARDVADFARLGYVGSVATPYDMIPLTDEVETVVFLKRAPHATVRVVYEDREVVAVDKDPNEPTTPQGEYAQSLLDRVRTLPGCTQAVPIHRLDEGTSGVCLFAKRTSHVETWAAALGAEDAKKTYTALVRGVIREKGKIDRSLTDDKKERPASTRYERIDVLTHHSLVRAYPNEGRTHQVRRHLAAIGHPILGDARYGDGASNRHLQERHGLERTFLHCSEIRLNHPVSGAALVLATPLAGDLESVVDSLRSDHGARQP